MELADGWLGRLAPEGGRYRPVVGLLGDPAKLAGLRRSWCAELRATEMLERPTGGWVRPDRDDVTVAGWALVWVPAS